MLALYDDISRFGALPEAGRWPPLTTSSGGGKGLGQAQPNDKRALGTEQGGGRATREEAEETVVDASTSKSMTHPNGLTMCTVNY